MNYDFFLVKRAKHLPANKKKLFMFICKSNKHFTCPSSITVYNHYIFKTIKTEAGQIGVVTIGHFLYLITSSLKCHSDITVLTVYPPPISIFTISVKIRVFID